MDSKSSMTWLDWLGLAFVFFMIAVVFPAASRNERDAASYNAILAPFDQHTRAWVEQHPAVVRGVQP